MANVGITTSAVSKFERTAFLQITHHPELSDPTLQAVNEEKLN